MSVEENKALYRSYIEEVFNKQNLVWIDANFASNWVHHDPAGPETAEAFKQRLTIQLAALPDTHFTVEDVVDEGDKVAARWTATGTHKGAMMGIPPTGKQVTITGMGYIRCESGKIVEDWTLHDALGMMQQLGVLPPPGESRG